MVPLKLNNAQAEYMKALGENPWVYVLKSRKLGITTIIAAVNFWSTLFTPNFCTLVLAHTDAAAKAIFKIYTRFYAHLPPFLKFPYKIMNKHELELEHGGYIVAGTSGSESARGATFHALHFSEFAQYENIDSIIASALSTAGKNPRVALETTANGLNPAFEIWNGQNGYKKIFISWLDAEDSREKKKPEWMPKEIQNLQLQYGLSSEQAYWAADTYLTRCAANWNTFLQEYPPEAHLAFISSGRKFFNTAYPHARPKEGYTQYVEPKKYRAYTIGVDTASGSEHGDYSSFVTLDVTNKKNPRIVSTYYERIAPSEFTRRVLKEAKLYSALVCVESNSYGLSVIEGLLHHEYGLLYRRTKYDRATKRWSENIGFSTNVATRSILMAKLQENISRNRLEVIDETLKYEMNSFVFSSRGKPMAQNGKHDDMIMATALALVAIEQIEPDQELKKKRAPSSILETLQFELQTGKLFNKNRDTFPEEPSPLDKNRGSAPMGDVAQ